MNIEAVKQLRERTFLSMNVCKKALEQTQGDIDKAIELLQKTNAVKTVDPLIVPREGVVQAKVVDGVGRIVEINCQTDFAAKSEIFLSFVEKFLISDLDRQDLVAEHFTKTERGQYLCRQLGEKVVIKKANTLWTDKLSVDTLPELTVSVCRSYNHHSKKIAVLISAMIEPQLVGNAKVLAFLDDCAMQIAATNPSFVSTEPQTTQQADIKTTEKYASQKAIFEDQVKDKPEKMREKIVSGKFEAWYKDVVLLRQESVVHPKKTIQSLQEELQQEFGTKFVIVDFIRYELGA